MKTKYKISFLIIILFLSFTTFANNKLSDNYLPSDLQSADFRPSKIKNLSKYYDSERNLHWYKYILDPSLKNMDIILEIKGMNFQELYLFEKQDSGYHYLGKSGNNFRHLSEKRTRFNQFDIRTSASKLYILGIADRFHYVEQINADSVDVFFNKEWFNFTFLGIYYGMVIMAVVFNLIFFFIFQEKRFVLYAAFLTSICAMFAFEDGVVSYFITNQFILNHFILISSLITIITACYFTYSFLDLENNFPVFKKIVIPINIAAVIISIIYLFTTNDYVFYAVNLTYFISTLMCCIAAIKLFKKDILARFFILTLGIVFIFGFGYLAYQLEVIDGSIFNRNSFQIASSFQIIAISFAIIYKVRKMLLENIQFRQEIVNHINEIETYRSNAGAMPEVKLDVLTDLSDTYDLTEREVEVLRSILSGLSNKAIADKLYISLSTVKFHTSNIYLKLDIKNRSQMLKLIQWS